MQCKNGHEYVVREERLPETVAKGENEIVITATVRIWGKCPCCDTEVMLREFKDVKKIPD